MYVGRCNLRTNNRAKRSSLVNLVERLSSLIKLILDMFYLLFIFLYSFRCICLPLGE